MMNTTVKSTYQSSIHVEYTDIYYRHRSVATVFPYRSTLIYTKDIGQ